MHTLSDSIGNSIGNILYPYGADNNDVKMNTTTDTDEERDAIYGYLKLNNFILGLKDIFVRMIILTKKKGGKKKDK